MFRVPIAGHVAATLQPLIVYGIVIGISAELALFGRRKARLGRRLRRRIAKRALQKTLSPPRSHAIPVWLIALPTLGVLTLLLTTGALYSFRQSETKSEFVERARLEHQAYFTYTAHMKDSLLYPTQTVTSAGENDPAQPIYTRLARSLDIHLNYTLATAQDAAIAGYMSVDVELSATEGWRRQMNIFTPGLFTGTEIRRAIPINFDEIWAVIDTVEKETDFRAGVYELRITPTYRANGQVGPEKVQTAYAPVLLMKMNRTLITIESPLNQNEEQVIGATETTPRSWNVAGRTIDLLTIREATTPAALLTLLALLVTTVISWLKYRRYRNDEAAQIQRRHRSILVSVTEIDDPISANGTHVSTITDLTRLARLSDCPILEQAITSADQGTYRYVVTDGVNVYEYCVPAVVTSPQRRAA